MKIKKFIPIATTLVLTSCFAPLATVTSCSTFTPLGDNAFVIENGVLKGFDPKLTPKQIENGVTETITLPSSVKSIDDEAFYKNDMSTIPSKVKHLDLSKCSLEKIGKYAFAKAPFTNLNFTTKPANANITIDSFAFTGCPNLTALTLGPNVAQVERLAFSELHKLNFLDLSAYSDIPHWNGDGIFNFSMRDGANVNVLDDMMQDRWEKYLDYQGIVAKVQYIPVVTIYDTEEFGDDVILKGFKCEDPEIIFKKIGKTFVIPEKFTKIADNAFYRNGKSTIPETIEELVFNDSDEANCETIGANAFNMAPFKKITLDSQVIEIGSNAFKNMPNCANIEFGEMPKFSNKWKDDAFSSSINNGTVHAKYEWIADKAKDYFGDFAKNWTFNFDEKLLDITIDGDEVILNGFNKTLSRELLSYAFDIVGDKFVIPDEVTKVADDAFIEEEGRTVETLIPSQVRTVCFNKESKCTTIGTRAFMMAYTGSWYKNNINNIILPKNLQNLGFAAFQGDPINFIDLSRCEFTSIPSGWEQQQGSQQWYYASNTGHIYINNENQVEMYTEYFKNNGLGQRVGKDWQFVWVP